MAPDIIKILYLDFLSIKFGKTKATLRIIGSTDTQDSRDCYTGYGRILCKWHNNIGKLEASGAGLDKNHPC